MRCVTSGILAQTSAKAAEGKTLTGFATSSDADAETSIATPCVTSESQIKISAAAKTTIILRSTIALISRSDSTRDSCQELGTRKYAAISMDSR